MDFDNMIEILYEKCFYMVRVSNRMIHNFWVPFFIFNVALFLFYLMPSKIKLVKYELFLSFSLQKTNNAQNGTQLYFDHKVENQGFLKTCQPFTYRRPPPEGLGFPPPNFESSPSP